MARFVYIQLEHSILLMRKIQDKKKEPAHGADVLRLWVATVEYWRDMSIGPTVLAQAAESLRKIRNSARFIMGNIGGEETRKTMIYVPKEELGIVRIFFSLREQTLT